MCTHWMNIEFVFVFFYFVFGCAWCCIWTKIFFLLTPNFLYNGSLFTFHILCKIDTRFFFFFNFLKVKYVVGVVCALWVVPIYFLCYCCCCCVATAYRQNNNIFFYTKMEKIYWPLIWIIFFAGIIYVNSAIPAESKGIKFCFPYYYYNV